MYYYRRDQVKTVWAAGKARKFCDDHDRIGSEK